MAPPKDIARSYPKRGLTADVGFRSEPKFCGDGSIELNGSSQYLNAELSSALGDSFTIMGWAKREGPLSSYNYIVNTGTSSGAGNAVSISITNTNPGILYFFDNSTSVNTSNTVEFNEWFHFALTVAPGAGNVKLYKNGIDGTPSHSVAIDLSDVTFEVGRRLGGIFYFRGKIFDLRVYDETLTQDQIRELLNNPGQTVPTGLTSADLIHRYLFETDANDSGATGNNLTANNSPTFGVDRAQLPRGLSLTQNAAQARVYTGRAVDFDGSADRLRAAHYNPSGDFLTTTGWVNADTLRSQGVIYNGSTGRNSFLFYMLSTGGLRFYWNDTTGDAAIDHQTTLTTGRWYHLAAVMDMSDPADHQVTFYIDGIAATGTRIASGFTGDNNYGFGNESGTAGWFDGLIADCRIYDVALTQAQIRELYHNPEQVLPTGVSASNLRRYYPLSDYNDTGGTGGRYFQDMGADGEPAEDQGSALMAFAQPVPCPQLGLQQSATRVYFERNSTRAQANLGSAPGATCTMSAWVMVDELFSYQYFMKNGTSITANNFFAFAINSARQLYAVQNSNILAQGSLALSDYGEWNHVVAMTKSTAPYVRFFINGVEDTSITDSGMVAFNLNSTFIEIGSDGGANHLKGFLNDCAIWDVELSDPEVASLYNSGVQGMDVSTVQSSNLKGWWKCDDLTSFKDYSGNGANATLTSSVNAASFPENASGSTIVGDFSMKRKGVSVLNPTFDPIATSSVVGVSAEIPGCDAISFDPTKGMSFTLAFRLQSLKPSPTAVWYPRFFAANASGSDYYLRFNSTHELLQFVLRDSASTVQLYNYTTGTVSDLDWHHIAITVDTSTSPNTTVKLWFDGALINTFASTNHNYAFTPDELRIGTYNYGNGNFPGAIANFRIYQAALSQGEVEQSYSSDMRLIKGLANE